jgi:hypothetical protein
MENEKNPDQSNVHRMARPKRRISRTRIVMLLLLIIAIPIFMRLAERAVRDNGDAIQQGFNQSFGR